MLQQDRKRTEEFPASLEKLRLGIAAQPTPHQSCWVVGRLFSADSFQTNLPVPSQEAQRSGVGLHRGNE